MENEKFILVSVPLVPSLLGGGSAENLVAEMFGSHYGMTVYRDGYGPPEFTLMPRSSKWSALRKRFLKDFPSCAACGGNEYLQVHHIEPFHVNPDKELNWNNLITLCQHPIKGCHAGIGHFWRWDDHNSDVVEDASRLLEKILARRKRNG